MRVVRQRSSRVVSFFLLSAMLSPSVTGTLVAVHLAAHHGSEHEGEDHEHASDLGVAWHGHTHDAGTPDHDHPLLRAGAVATVAKEKAQANTAGALSAPHGVVLSTVASTAASRAVAVVGVGPPPPPSSIAILRI